MKLLSTFTTKLKPLVLATAVTAAALTTTSCGATKTNNQELDQDTVELTTLKKGKLDLSKPNLPEINEDYIYYKNLDGDVFEVFVERGYNKPEAIGSLYKAIKKMSTEESPNIKDVGRFYAEVESNIMAYYSSSGPDMLHTTQKLKNLFDVYTHPDSEEGRTITVEEYTNMMHAWSSTSKKSMVE